MIPNQGLPIVYLNCLIVVMIGLLGWVTNNPLTVMGLLLLQNVPVVDSNTMMAMAFAGQQQQGAEEDPEHPHDSGDHKIGYLAQMREKVAA